LDDVVTASAKKEFIRWFLSHYQLKKKEGTWLFNYILSDERLLERIHFTEDLRNRDKTMIVSAICSGATPFQFQKLTKVYYDVEKAFHDIRLNPHEDLYVTVYFRDRLTCSRYLTVLEGRPLQDQRVSQETMMSLLAEIIMDRSIRKHRMQKLQEEIDISLLKGEKGRFLALTSEWNELRKLELDSEVDN